MKRWLIEAVKHGSRCSRQAAMATIT